MQVLGFAQSDSSRSLPSVNMLVAAQTFLLALAAALVAAGILYLLLRPQKAKTPVPEPVYVPYSPPVQIAHEPVTAPAPQPVAVPTEPVPVPEPIAAIVSTAENQPN